MNTQILRHDCGARMSRAVVHAGTVYLCGQVGEDFSESIEQQTRSMLEKVDTLLAEVGSNRQHVLSATIYLADMSDFAAMNQVWEQWLPENSAPARACVQASMAHPDVRVEISVVAAVASQTP
jgi:enamine deaminase RidA (YjgF/YER057c/UK114 family)